MSTPADIAAQQQRVQDAQRATAAAAERQAQLLASLQRAAAASAALTAPSAR